MTAFGTNTVALTVCRSMQERIGALHAKPIGDDTQTNLSEESLVAYEKPYGNEQPEDCAQKTQQYGEQRKHNEDGKHRAE